MASLQYVTLDVFTTKRFKGNSLAVIFLSESNPITQEQKQLLATEFNYSETIFFHPVGSDPSQPRKIDIFTTEQELPFAGHPTIGAASWLLVCSKDKSPAKEAEQALALTTKAGNIPISLSPEDPNKVSASIPHNVHIHSTRMSLSEVLRLHPTLTQSLDAQSYQNGFPVVSVVKGMTAVHICLPSLEALAQATTTAESIPSTGVSAGGYLDDGWDVEGHVSIYFYVRDVWDDELQKNVIRSRMMAGSLEDAATGSAASGLASYLTLTDPEINAKGMETCTIVQGVEMGKRSEIGIQVILKDNKKEIETVHLQGSAVKVAEGAKGGVSCETKQEGRKMLRSNYQRETPSPSSHPLLQGLKSTAKSGRKSSLTTSFHNFARNALQPLKTRPADEGASYGKSATRSSSLPVRARGISSPKHVFGSGPSGVKSPTPALPPLPAFLSRGADSNIPKPAQPATKTYPRLPAQKENLIPIQPEKKPFIGYQDLKTLHGVKGQAGELKLKGGTTNEAPSNPSPDSTSDASSQDTIRPTYRTNIPIPKSASHYLPASFQHGAPLTPLEVCKPIYAFNDSTDFLNEKEGLGFEGLKDGIIAVPKGMQGAIDQFEGGSVEAFRAPKPRPNLIPRQLPKSKTLGFFYSKPKLPPADPCYPKLDAPRCYCEDHDDVEVTVEKYGLVSGGSFSVEAPSTRDSGDVKAVKTAKPQQYWLGRLVTLMNSFHHEAAFNEPDPVTGYGVAGNTLEGKAPLSVNLDDYYTKRAFMVLERACLTSEAAASLTEFKDAYSRRFGRKFSQRYTGEIDKGSPKSEKSTGKGEAGMMNILRSVRKSFG
ncbi:uncharacterized protein GIQ15_06112 [Arthroderma uncinatum]|uniref:uncharacterized protein n=1 Tax=Arthroderma uncinatum TaxID=74035 RepID=UPI00144AA88B|nr:uncharacterized protein GIQ15_06112 [Arthroderma uncinatum]KAF3480765.1 hypothetical protein GIQ15_06112 [Arthroderma uncinatum]